MDSQIARFLISWLSLCLLGEPAWGQMETDSNAPAIDLQTKHVLKAHKRPNSLSFSRDGRRFAFNDGFSAKVWDTQTWKQVCNVTDDKNFIRGVALSPDGQILAFTRSDDTAIRLLDVASGRIVHTLNGHLLSVTIALFSPDGKRIAAADDNDTIKLWDVNTGRDLGRFPTQLKGVCYAHQIAFSPDGGVLAAATEEDGVVHLLATRTGKEVNTFLPPDRALIAPRGLAISPDGQYLAVGQSEMGSPSTVIAVWNVHKDKLQWKLQWPTPKRTDEKRDPRKNNDRSGIWTLAFTYDGRCLVAACCDGQIRVWELSTGKERYQAQMKATHVAAVPAGPLLACSSSADGNERIVLWDCRTCMLPRRQSTPQEMEKAWDDLGLNNAALAYERIREMASAPKLALSILKKRLPAIESLKASEIARLIQDLDNDSFQVRDRAKGRLSDLGELAKASLSQAVKKANSLESRKTIQELLDALNGPLAGDRLRFVRAVEILETIDSPEARKMLERLSGGNTGHLLTREAKAALQRLNGN